MTDGRALRVAPTGNLRLLNRYEDTPPEDDEIIERFTAWEDVPDTFTGLFIVQEAQPYVWRRYRPDT